MGRILKAYETRFHWLLQRVGARRLESGVQWLVDKARRLSVAQKLSEADGLTQVYEELATREPFRKPHTDPGDIRFFCDAGLGGLARWLRAAGYEALWESGIDDDKLLCEAREVSATILTTDSMLMERRVVRRREIPAYWLPPTLGIQEQLELVFREFDLEVRAPRCMACGGTLCPGDKELLRERIPPRTYRWLNEFFICERCGKLFWHGTHWRRIVSQLQKFKFGPQT